MKLQSLKILFLLPAFLFMLASVRGQESTSANDTIAVVQESISIGDIAEESEKLGQRILKIKGTLEENRRVAEIDSIAVAIKPEIDALVDSLIFSKNEFTLRDLKVHKVEWTNYETVLNGYQDDVKNRSEEISKTINYLFKELERWKLTKKKLVEKSESIDVVESIDGVITILEDIMKAAQARLDIIFLTQKKITNLILTVDQEISNIELAENQKRKDYFVLDNPPIWKGAPGPLPNDSISAAKLSSLTLIKEGITENKRQFLDFFYLNTKTFVFQLIFLIILLGFLIAAHKKMQNKVLILKSPIETQAKTILKNPVLATLSVGILVSAFFYDSMVPAYAEFHILVILFGTVLLLPKVTDPRFSTFLWLLFAVYMLNTFEAYIGVKTSLVRWLLIIDAILLSLSLLIGRKIVVENPENFSQIFRLFRFISILYIILLVLSVVSNMIGMVALSNYITKAVLFSLVFGMITYLAVKVFTSIFILIFKFRTSTNIQTITAMVNATHQRIRPLFNFVGFIFWLYFTLSGFELFGFLVNWFDEMMDLQWQIGEMTISLGGILAFVGIFVFTLIIAKLAAALFQDEWMVNVLPRGIAPAISLVLRIVVITLGLYAGFSAAGVDLSKLGFILGALGVGIGFGLQNVVLNFVSGLILAFERPINLGDTIEVDMEMGVVTNIGVRSSNIRAYSGAEVIIPNGDLISKKVINWTLSNRNRRSKVPMKTSPEADPEKVIELFNQIALDHPNTSAEPAPKTYFYGYCSDGNLNFALLYWTTFSDTLKTDSEIALRIFKKLKEEGIQAPAPVRRIIQNGSGNKD